MNKRRLDDIISIQLKQHPSKEYWFERHMLQAEQYEEWAREEDSEEMKKYWEEWAEQSYILAEIFNEEGDESQQSRTGS